MFNLIEPKYYSMYIAEYYAKEYQHIGFTAEQQDRYVETATYLAQKHFPESTDMFSLRDFCHDLHKIYYAGMAKERQDETQKPTEW